MKLILLKLLGIAKYIIGISIALYGFMNIIAVSTKDGIPIFLLTQIAIAYSIFYAIYLGFSGYFDFKGIFTSNNIILKIGIYLSFLLIVLIMLSYLVDKIDNFVIGRIISIVVILGIVSGDILRVKKFAETKKSEIQNLTNHS